VRRTVLVCEETGGTEGGVWGKVSTFQKEIGDELGKEGQTEQ